jgi:hypothetical protein
LIAVQEHGCTNSHGSTAHGSHQRLSTTRQRMQESDNRSGKFSRSRHRHEIFEIVAGAENIGGARDDQAFHAIGLARILDRRRHRFVHCECKRVLLLGPVHPDLADRAFVADQNVGHRFFQMSNK